MVVLGPQLDLMIWEVFSNLNDSMILWNGAKAGNPHLTMSKWEGKSHPASSSVGTLFWLWDILFYSSVWPIFCPAKLWKDDVWNPAGKGGIGLFSPVAECLRLFATHWVSASAFIVTKPWGECHWRNGHQ